MKDIFHKNPIFLVGKSNKGRNRVKELGNKWVLCIERGDKLLICPAIEYSDFDSFLELIKNSSHVRWIDKWDDKDFDIKQAGFFVG